MLAEMAGVEALSGLFPREGTERGAGWGCPHPKGGTGMPVPGQAPCSTCPLLAARGAALGTDPGALVPPAPAPFCPHSW